MIEIVLLGIAVVCLVMVVILVVKDRKEGDQYEYVRKSETI